MEITKKRDWGLVLAGALLVITGIVFIAAPGITLVMLTMIAGAAFLVSGIFDIIFYVRNRKTGLVTGWTIAYAVLDILIGLMLLLHPIVLAEVIPWMIGAFFIAFGIFEAIAAFKVKKLGTPVWGWMLFSGIVEALCGVLFFIFPASVVFFMAAFILMHGVSLIIYGASTKVNV